MKNILICLLAMLLWQSDSIAQCSTNPNLGFESGTGAGWTFNQGTFGPPMSTTPGITWLGAVSVPTPGVAVLTSGGADLYGGFPQVCPLIAPNTRSLLIGTNVTGGQAASARYTITTGSDPYIVLNYYFAVVFENPGASHTAPQMPQFDVKVYNSSGGIVGCSSYQYNVSNVTGLTLSGTLSPLGQQVYYTNWQSASLVIPASASPATIEFVVRGCSPGAHFGYAYVDMDCSSFTPEIKPCYPGTFNLSAAPTGYATYNWYKVSPWTHLGATTAGSLYPTPPGSLPVPSVPTDYALVMTPFPGMGCAETLYVRVNPTITPVVGTIDPIVLCLGDSLLPSFTGTTTAGGTWAVSPASVAEFTPTGKVKALSPGTALITYTVSNPPCGTATVVGTVSVNPLPSLISFAEITGNHCEGDMLTFIVNTDAGSPPKQISYSYVLGGVPSGSYLVSADAAGHFSVSLPATGPTTSFHLDGIYDPVTGCWRWVDEWIHVCVDPHPTMGTLWGPSVLCEGETVNYNVGGVGGIGSGYTFWEFIPTTGAPVVSFSGFGTSSVTMTGVTAGSGILRFYIKNCCDSIAISVPITILPKPVVTHLIYVPTPGCEVPCPGTALTFKFTGTPGATVHWKWEDPTTPGLYTTGTPVLLSLGGVGFGTIPAGALGEGMITIFITDIIGANGCHNSIGPVGMVTVEWPKANFGQIPNAGICEGDCFRLMFYGPPGGTVYYSSSSGGGLSAPVMLDPVTGWGATPMLCPTVTTTYQITGVTGSCCTHMYSGPSATIAVMPAPAISLTSNSPVCEGSALILTASCPTCTEPYSWAFPGGGSATTPVGTPSYSINPVSMASDGTHTVTGSVFYPKENVQCTATATTKVIVHPLPTASMRCMAKCTPGGGAIAVLHITGTGSATVMINTVPASGPDIPVVLNSAGFFNYITPITGPTSFIITDVISPDSCSLGRPVSVCYVTPPADTLPVVTCWTTQGEDYVWRSGFNCPDASPSHPVIVHYIATAMDGMTSCTAPAVCTLTAPSYTVTACDLMPTCSFSSPCATLSITWVMKTAVEVGGCYWDDSCLSMASRPAPQPGVGMSANNDFSITISPNPNSGTFTLSGNLPVLSDGEFLSIDILNALGQMIQTEETYISRGVVNKTIDLGKEIPNGTYMIRIRNNNVKKTLRFTLTR